MTVAHFGFVFDMMNLDFDGRLDSNEYNFDFDLDADHDERRVGGRVLRV
jgi:hypothetical protein